MRNIKLILLVSFFIGALQSANARQANKIESIDEASQRAVLTYVNEYRVKHGRKPLKLNALISAEATKHSQNMAKHLVPFGHKNFNTRIHRLFAEIKQCRGGAENVAYNYKDAKDVVRNWLTSSGHRRNIEGNYNLTGIGLARDKKGKIYFTQIFIRTI